MYKDVLQKINELQYKGVLNKQRSINKLFPPFYDRVKAVANNGGVRLKGVEPSRWHFKITSGTENDKEYDAYIRFKNMPEVLNRLAKNRKLWNKARTGVDYRKLGVELLYQPEVELLCSCPAFQYWGPAYILTKRDAKYTEPENRPPVVRNPKQYGAVCKHLQLLLDVFPMYSGTMASFLKKYYGEAIQQAEDEAQAEFDQYQAAGQALSTRADALKRGVPPEDEEAELKQEEEEVSPEVEDEVEQSEEERETPDEEAPEEDEELADEIEKSEEEREED